MKKTEYTQAKTVSTTNVDEGIALIPQGHEIPASEFVLDVLDGTVGYEIKPCACSAATRVVGACSVCRTAKAVFWFEAESLGICATCLVGNAKLVSNTVRVPCRGCRYEILALHGTLLSGNYYCDRCVDRAAALLNPEPGPGRNVLL